MRSSGDYDYCTPGSGSSLPPSPPPSTGGSVTSVNSGGGVAVTTATGSSPGSGIGSPDNDGSSPGVTGSTIVSIGSIIGSGTGGSSPGVTGSITGTGPADKPSSSFVVMSSLTRFTFDIRKHPRRFFPKCNARRRRRSEPSPAFLHSVSEQAVSHSSLDENREALAYSMPACCLTNERDSAP